VSVNAWFSNDEISAAPGATVTLTLSVHNLGDSTDSYTILPAGLTASWTTVASGNLTLFADSQDFVSITISPPPIPSTTAGPTVVSVRVIPQSDPDEAVVAEAIVDVLAFDDRRIVALQPIQRTRRRATYEFMVENHGNNLASCRLRLIDASDRVDGSFDPPAVGVAPGGSNLVRLRAHVVGNRFRRTTRTLEFEVEAEQPGHQPAAASMALVQPPTISGDAVAKALAALAAVTLAVVAWFGLVRPAIDDAVATEVGAQLGELAPTVGTDPIATTTVPQVVTDDEADGVPAFYRLEVAPALEQTADDVVTIPDGQQFDLTDVRIENPFNDGGVATLLVNGDQVFVWSLQNVRGQLFEPRITEIRLVGGDVVTFTVRCRVVGNAELNTCANAVNLGGIATEAAT
jgi:hypothetical protein